VYANALSVNKYTSFNKVRSATVSLAGFQTKFPAGALTMMAHFNDQRVHWDALTNTIQDGWIGAHATDPPYNVVKSKKIRLIKAGAYRPETP